MLRRQFIQTVGLGAAALGAGFRVLGTSRSAVAGSLPRSSPEAQGVTSGGIIDFLNSLPNEHLELHSFMLVRRGHVVAETWWSPYRAAAPHSLYSLSKSFTSTAVGFAASEGKLKLTDRVVSFFPDQLPAMVGDNLAALEIRHLLSMSVGHKADSIGAVARNPKPDWVKTFLSLPIEYPPGSVFLYDTGATFMLSAIVQKVCGERVVDYLQPRLFAPLEVQDKHWDASPLGINTGGWGLSVTTETLAKFGQLYLQKGRWNDVQLLPAGWAEQATSFKIQQPATWNSGSDPKAQADYVASLKDPAAALQKLQQNSDWYQGYAYQFWRCRHNAFRGDGAFGQFCLVMPDQDAVLVTTSETSNMQGILNLVWDHLLPAMRTQRLGTAPKAQRELAYILSTRQLMPPEGSTQSPTARKISARRFSVQTNALRVSEIVLTFHSDSCVFEFKVADVTYKLKVGLGTWIDGDASLPGEPPGLLPVPTGGPIKFAAAGAWRDPETFAMRWQFYETPHHDTVTCKFIDKEIRVEMLNSITEALGANNALRPEMRPTLIGTAIGSLD